MSMTGASMFWLDTLYDCDLDRSLPLPFDRYRLADENRTGRGMSVSFDFGEHISHNFLTYGSTNDVAPIHVALASYYALLFKLTNGERDLCVGMNTHGRYKKELMSVIGMFVKTIPLRCQLDPHWSFHQLTEHVQEITTSSMKYSYFLLQRILAQHPNTSKHNFLDTSFEFLLNGNENTQHEIMIGDNRLHAVSTSIRTSENEIMSEFDFSLTMEHDLNINHLSCTIDASLDLFKKDTIYKIAQRFHSMLEQLFLFSDERITKPICELSIILPNERILLNSMNNTEVLFPSATCIHHEFIYQVMKHQQKLAVELDEQSLTYSELLYYVQLLAVDLLHNYCIVPGDIVCQCVERSLSMVSWLISYFTEIIRTLILIR